ncbi:tail terminator [Arthrobacter phage Constance]|uniref:Tail terminator n=2 Tax=Bridgettevirus TaxID=2733170 RepID=A0A3G2KGH3_9CAUD|nr:tail terminator [Arthrobacter phage Constance]YP_009815490.1 tail terminator [Arthrobacter phage Judy]AYN57418.1 tail terminator [Arthrobacter phage Constance]AYN58082.1 tail terminator [Arthrobacter phage Judy]WMI32953.1 tail terminator [Arthrobacter phage PeggyLeg03]
MSGDALAAAVEGLITGMTVYQDGEVPDEADLDFPYVFVSTNFPDVTERAKSRAVQGRALRVRATAVGLSVSSVRITAQKLSDCLEGKKPTVAGWNLGRIESVPNGQVIQTDKDVNIPDYGNPLYQPFEWILIGSQLQ